MSSVINDPSKRRKSSSLQTSEEELEKLQNSKKNDEDNEEKIEKFEDDGFASNNPYLSIRSQIERMLTSKNYEELLVQLVDNVILEEQNALKEETKKEIQVEKYIIGLALTSANCYGDQRNFLYLMAERLGVKR